MKFYFKYLITFKFLFFNGENALYHAIRNVDFDTVKLLVEKGIPVDILNNRKESPLYVAIKCKNQQMTDYLLQNGANPNTPENPCLPLSIKLSTLPISSTLHQHGARDELRTPRSSRQTLKVTSSRKEEIERNHIVAKTAQNGECALCHTTENLLYLIPCNHQVICKQCIDNIDFLPRCPICRLSFMGATPTPHDSA